MTYRRRRPAGWAVHPGEILKEEFLRPMKLSSYEVAKRLGVPVPRIHDIVLRKRGITADTAVLFAKLFGTTEQFWMNLQTSYEIHQATARQARALKRIRPVSASAAD